MPRPGLRRSLKFGHRLNRAPFELQIGPPLVHGLHRIRAISRRSALMMLDNSTNRTAMSAGGDRTNKLDQFSPKETPCDTCLGC